MKCGHVVANIDERLFRKKHTVPEYNTFSSNTGDAIMDTSAIKQTTKSKSVLPALKKQMLTFPDKVGLPKMFELEISINLCEKLLWSFVTNTNFSC